MPRHAAIHHRSDKMACITFFIGPEYKRLNLRMPDRAAAIRHVKSMYRGASNISVVFYVPIAKESQDEPQT